MKLLFLWWQKHVYFENAAISYDNLENYSKAEEYFNKVIYYFKTIDGKSEFFKGLMLIKNNNLLPVVFSKIYKKNYVGAASGIRAEMYIINFVKIILIIIYN